MTAEEALKVTEPIVRRVCARLPEQWHDEMRSARNLAVARAQAEGLPDGLLRRNVRLRLMDCRRCRVAGHMRDVSLDGMDPGFADLLIGQATPCVRERLDSELLSRRAWEWAWEQRGRQGRIVRLWMAGVGSREMGERLGVSMRSVRSVVSRMRARLRVDLMDWDGLTRAGT